MIQNIGSIPPGSRVGGKALGLDLLVKQGIAVPSAQVLSPSDAEGFVVPAGRYAVRSSAAVEDGKTASFAGQFLSRTRVAARAVPAAIREVIQHARVSTGSTKGLSIIVQQWIDAKVSGVAFSCHPTKDMPDVMVIDAVTGSNEGLMSGKINAQRAFAWSDTELVPDSFPLPKHALSELKQDILRIASIMGCPVDIEWAWDGQTLWILQARPITALPTADSLDVEEARVMRLFAMRPALVLSRNDFAESSPRPNEATFQLIRQQYRDEGPFHRASRELGLVYDTKRANTYLQRVFGWLYSDATCQPVRTPRGWFAGMRAVLRLSKELERFARAYYGASLPADQEKTYAKASILAQFAQTQASRPVAPDIWPLRMKSIPARRAWKEPTTMAALYAVIREDAKVATYVASTEPSVEMPITITAHEAFNLRAPIYSSGTIAGEGVSAGVAQGISIYGSTPQPSSKPGILVVTALTPEWIPFLDHKVKGVISETGSSMSHGAIQCRERGIPAVFGAKGARRGLKEGREIAIDGKRGTITIV